MECPPSTRITAVVVIQRSVVTAAVVWPGVSGIAYGGDYNPEQWPRETWIEDVALMREAGVNLVSIGIFSWALLEPREGEYDFGWLDDIMGLLHANGIAVDLGTPTASPPAWFFAAYPSARVINREGAAMGFGSRGQASPSSREYLAASSRIASALASRYHDHPAVVLWHVHNEYGVPVGEDYSPASVAAFRAWLLERHGSLDGLNAAWGTAFWGQHYGDWAHVGAPAAAPTVVNPAQRLDFARFSDHQLLQCFIAQRDAIRAHASQPITTNFMATMSLTADLWAWACEVDIVSNDHYLTAADPDAHIGLALAADLTRSVARGRPWILMEHSTSAVNWQPRNVAKRPGEMSRNSLSHLARGADAVLFFQWRAGRSGAEKFHSAMLPHAGKESRVWREVTALGEQVAALAEVRGSTVHADVAVIWDTESFWAQDLEWRPSVDVSHSERMRAYYERLWRDGITTDFAHPGDDLTGYKLVVVPALYLLTTEHAANLTRYVAAGGTLVVSFFSAIVDENDAVHAGGFGAPLRDVLGVLVEEFLPLREGETSTVLWNRGNAAELDASLWHEDLIVDGAEVVATYVDGPGAGGAAVTRHEHGEGAAWYVSTALGVGQLAFVMSGAYADAGIDPPRIPEGLEVVTRHGDDNDFVIAINHGDAPVSFEVTGTELLGGAVAEGNLQVSAGGVAVVRAASGSGGGGR